ncbi:MAG: hypothetical protein ACRCW9_03075 [Cetobacterium sp.]
MNQNFNERYQNHLERLDESKSMSFGTEFQSGNALLKFKFAESVAGAIHNGGYAGYNLMSTYKINPLLDFAGELTGLNNLGDKLINKIPKMGVNNITEGFQLSKNIGIKYVTGDALKASRIAKDNGQNMMRGLNLTFGNNGSETNLLRYINNTAFNGALKNPLANNQTIKTIAAKTGSFFQKGGVKAVAGVASKFLGFANIAMAVETAVDFAEMYNEHLMDANIEKAINYNANQFSQLQSEQTNAFIQHNQRKMMNTNNELNYVLSTVNTAEKYIGG